MDDSHIIALYWERNEQAIRETERKYGRYCHKIALQILENIQDAEECVNDTYLRTWEAIPPQRPSRLGAFLGKITRNLALDRFKARHAAKREGGEFTVSIEELGECIPAASELDTEADACAIGEAINTFLRKESPTARKIFVCRYFYGDSLSDICRRLGISESKVKSSLFRTRSRLREHLEKEGIHI